MLIIYEKLWTFCVLYAFGWSTPCTKSERPSEQLFKTVVNLSVYQLQLQRQ